MKNCLILSFCSLLCILSFPVKAQKGCIASNIPFQANETMYMSYNGSYYELYGQRITEAYDIYCIRPTGYNCVVRGLASYTGKEVLFAPLPCPLDAELYLLLLCSASYAFIALRKNFSFQLTKIEAVFNQDTSTAHLSRYEKIPKKIWMVRKTS